MYFSGLNGAKARPLIALPVTNKPPVNPERAPSLIELDSVGLATNFLKIKKVKLNRIKNVPSINSKTWFSKSL